MADAQDTPNTPVLAGLKPGRIVNYVMRDGDIRPLLIVSLSVIANAVNGVLFFDPLVDGTANHPTGLPVLPSGFPPHAVVFVSGVPWSQPADAADTAAEPGSWHWPTREPVIAAAVDAAALQTQLTASINSMLDEAVAVVRKEVTEKALGDQEQLIATINEKLQATLDQVNASLNSHSDMIRQLIDDAKAALETPVLDQAGKALPGFTAPSDGPAAISSPEQVGMTGVTSTTAQVGGEVSAADLDAKAADDAAKAATAGVTSGDTQQAPPSETGS